MTSTALRPSHDYLMRDHFPWGELLTQTLTRITNGHDAQKLLDAGGPDQAGSIVQLPSFVHIPFNGHNSPNRITYPDAATVLFVADDEDQAIAFEIPNSLLPATTGTIRIQHNAVGGHTALDAVPDMVADGQSRPAKVTEVLSPSAAHAQLRRIVDDGRNARFEFAAALQRYTEHAVDAAARSVYSEIVNLTPDDLTSPSSPAVSQAEQERIVTELLYGSDGKQDSVILRMIDRAACTDWAIGRHVSRRMAQGIWGAAETHVRRSINDPHVGRIVRSLAREYGITDPAELLDVFRRRYPTKRMGADRIRRSLEVQELFTSSGAISAIRCGAQIRTQDRIPASRRGKSAAPKSLEQPTLALWPDEPAGVAA